jgi:Glycosyl transferase family 2
MDTACSCSLDGPARFHDNPVNAMSIQCPTVSVLMAVYNGQQYLPEAIESILSQSFTDFEFLVIDDGSEDSSLAIIQSYRDPRICLIRNATNRGLAASLNLGIAAATGRYIARMDADDVSLPARLSRQVDFMEAHQNVGVCGTWVEIIGINRKLVWEYPSDCDAIQARLLFDSPLAHPSTIFNRELLQKAQLSYDASYPCAQDYELWSRAAGCFALANLPEVLVFHRLHAGQIGQRESSTQQTWASKIRQNQLNRLGLSPTNEEFATHTALSTWTWPTDVAFLEESETWFLRLSAANKRTGLYPEPAFSRVMGERWMAVCQSVQPQLSRRLLKSPLGGSLDLVWKRKIRGGIRRGLSLLGFDRAGSGSS